MRRLAPLSAAIGLTAALAALVLVAPVHGSRAAGAQGLAGRALLVVDGTPTLRVTLATTFGERARGVRGRPLKRGEGMWFQWPSDTEGAFWMQGVPDPLVLAWVGADRKVIALRRMVPCASTCRLYWPPGPFRSAIELRPDDLRRSGLRVGSEVALRRTG
jgi:uncharacterized membrane protein (UPF0127 family)